MIRLGAKIQGEGVDEVAFMIRIRLAGTDRYVAKVSSSYAVIPDSIWRERDSYKEGSFRYGEKAWVKAHWFTGEEDARAWTSVKALRDFLKVCAGERWSVDEFSQYEFVDADGVAVPLKKLVG